MRKPRPDEIDPQFGLVPFWAATGRTSTGPGMALSSIPATATSELRAAIAAGVVKILERPSVTTPGRINKYVVPADYTGK